MSPTTPRSPAHIVRGRNDLCLVKSTIPQNIARVIRPRKLRVHVQLVTNDCERRKEILGCAVQQYQLISLTQYRASSPKHLWVDCVECCLHIPRWYGAEYRVVDGSFESSSSLCKGCDAVELEGDDHIGKCQCAISGAIDLSNSNCPFHAARNRVIKDESFPDVFYLPTSRQDLRIAIHDIIMLWYKESFRKDLGPQDFRDPAYSTPEEVRRRNYHEVECRRVIDVLKRVMEYSEKVRFHLLWQVLEKLERLVQQFPDRDLPSGLLPPDITDVGRSVNGNVGRDNYIEGEPSESSYVTTICQRAFVN
ncbi:unnamed protein product [Mycena citricolor]|uniref:Uncharacterized protein n=1 Tax=Mycena citricolor TaxID=2018698 RepID=A0AAD2HSF4_9AGAR|nr:unnamed protein product [Mycena citricolor]